MNLDCCLQLSRLWHSSIKTVKNSYIIVFQCCFNVSLHPPLSVFICSPHIVYTCSALSCIAIADEGSRAGTLYADYPTATSTL